MIKFNIPVFTDKTNEYVSDVFAQQHVAGDGKYDKLDESVSYSLNFNGAYEI